MNRVDKMKIIIFNDMIVILGCETGPRKGFYACYKPGTVNLVTSLALRRSKALVANLLQFF